VNDTHQYVCVCVCLSVNKTDATLGWPYRSAEFSRTTDVLHLYADRIKKSVKLIFFVNSGNFE
jgi:hypothetical protein